jgi:hypothetical protein
MKLVWMHQATQLLRRDLEQRLIVHRVRDNIGRPRQSD